MPKIQPIPEPPVEYPDAVWEGETVTYDGFGAPIVEDGGPDDE